MTAINMTKVREFLEVLGVTEEPMGMLYTNEQPTEGISPKPGTLPTVEAGSSTEGGLGFDKCKLDLCDRRNLARSKEGNRRVF